MRVVVVGAGSWGTALALVLARGGHEVGLVAHAAEHTEALRADRENRAYLPGFALPDSISVFGHGEDAGAADFAVCALPTGTVKENLFQFEGYPVVCMASKGLEPESGSVLSEVVERAIPGTTVVALSGPNLAMEIVKGVPTAAVSASPDLAAAELVRNAFNGPMYRVYISDDRKGVELAGALKNVIAIGAGISDGMGFGDNTKGAFVARGLNEMVKLGMALGARMETFLGLAGVGDLFATASSRLSRNYRVGFALGQGKTLSEAVSATGQVAEGVPTCTVAIRLAEQHGVDVPLMVALHDVMHGETTVLDAVMRLMERTTLRETNV